MWYLVAFIAGVVGGIGLVCHLSWQFENRFGGDGWDD